MISLLWAFNAIFSAALYAMSRKPDSYAFAALCGISIVFAAISLDIRLKR